MFLISYLFIQEYSGNTSVTINVEISTQSKR